MVIIEEKDSGSKQIRVLSTKDWILNLLILMIPIVNIIMLFIWAFGSESPENKARANFAKASLIIMVIPILFILFLAFVGFAFMGY